jgi:hypothetical protein
MSTWIERRPPTTSPVASETWDLVPAEIGSGSWLVAQGAGSWRIWAPPGVVLTGEPDEALELWTTVEAGWSSPQSVTVSEVLAVIPGDFRKWVVEATEGQLRILGMYIASVDDEPSAALARETRDQLSEELAAVEHARRPDPAAVEHARRPDPARIGARPAQPSTEATEDSNATVPSSFAALTDTEFAGLVRSLLAATFSNWLEEVGAGCAGSDVITGLADGQRQIFQVEHHPTADPQALVERARAHAMTLRDSCADMHWVITSNSIGSRLRRRFLRAVGPWLSARYTLIDADTLTGWLRNHPAAEREHPKWLAARAAETGVITSLSAPKLASFAVTEAQCQARRHLHDEGVAVIVGGYGSGKSMMLAMLLAEASLDGFTPVSAPRGIPGSEQSDQAILYLDDADDECYLARMVQAATACPGVRAVVTTRDPHLASRLDASVVNLNNYELHDRARVYYNHLWNAEHLHPEARAALADPSVYWPLLGNSAFTPRLAEEIVSAGPAAFENMPIMEKSMVQPDACISDLFARARRRALPWVNKETV